jgi:hypothetical protein
MAKRIYRSFAEKEVDRRRIKSVAFIDRIVSFLSPGVEGEGIIPGMKAGRWPNKTS